VNQRQSADLGQRLTEAWVDWNGNQDPHDSRNTERSVQAAIFNQCFDFLPENARAAIVRDPDDGPPVIAALDGDGLYLISVDKPGEGERPGTTDCSLMPVDPRRSAVACRVTYYGERVNENPLRRETVWAFILGDRKLSLVTQVSPESPLPPEEEFAQALAGLIGWAQFPSD
jgi:hypothetical protein